MLQVTNKKTQKNVLFGRIIFICIIVLSATAVSDGYAQTKVNGSLSFIEEIPVLTLWGTPREQGFAYGYLMGDRILTMFNDFLTENEMGISKDRYEKAFIPSINRMKIEQVYEEELEAMLEGMKAVREGNIFVPFLGRDLKYTDLVAINCLNDIFRMGCSSVSVWGDMTTNGSPITGRNTDWHKISALIENQIVVVRIPSKESERLGFVSVIWPGIIGCITGMNEKGIVLTSHDSRGLQLTASTGFYPYMLTFRSIIESTSPGTAIQNVEEILNSRVTGIGKNLMITIPTGSDGPRAVVFEVDGNRDKENGFTKRFPDEANAYMVCTNHFRERTEPSSSCWRYALLNKRLEDMSQKDINNKKITTEKIWALLGEVVLPGWRTHHSVVFEPDEKVMHVALAETKKDAPFCKKIRLNISELLKLKD